MNILIIQTAFLGDLVLSTGFFKRIREIHPEAKIYLLVNKGTEGILENFPHVDQIISFDKSIIKKSLLGFFRFIQSIRAINFSICYSPHFSHRSSIIAFFSGAKKRIGYKQAGFSFLLTETYDRPRLGMHEIQKLFRLLGEEEKIYKPELYYNSKSETFVQAILHENKILPKNYIVIAPSSIWETKRMPKEKFKELAELILKSLQLTLVFIGSNKDKTLVEEITKDLDGKVLSLAGKTNLSELSVVIQNSRLVITNDSSPIHIASAFNIPTLAIFGATVLDFGYGPVSDKQYVSEVNGLDCRPCGIHGGNFCPKKHFRCMKDQDIPRMFLELKKLLGESNVRTNL
ncbi:MAG: lipopolysaccharide heptosyltransferase II [Leptospiraceae bacterium]|nr:lipopolysaccharide heptosyltransferase II [Leptospiraceae bacterium]